MIRGTLCVVFLLVASACSQRPPMGNYTHELSLQTDQTTGNAQTKLYWEAEGDLITFEVHAQTTGWIGIGISPNGGMQGADIYVAWVKDGIAQISDRHGPTSSNGFPDKDSRQNVNLLAASEEDGWTVIKFSRELAGCEATDDLAITSSTTKVIWAYGEGDPSGDDITASDVHTTTNRGTVTLYLLDSNAATSGCTLPDGPSYITQDLVMTGFSVPAADTYYNCRLLRMPTVTNKVHIVKYEPVITSGNEKYVHHILLYQCGDVDTSTESQLGTDAPCYGTGALSHFSTCTSVIIGWAVGGSEFCFPTEAGFPFGGTSGGPKIVKLEMHYDNPDSLSSIVDSSGIRLTYTSTLRANDAGLLQVGHVVNGLAHVIPPQAKSFTTVGFCAGSCLRDAMNAESVTELNIFGLLLHSHLAGRQLRLRHIRNGVEQPDIKDDNYDFNYQETRSVVPSKQFQPGDIFQMECVYNTEGRTQMTLGGFATTDEMCLAFVSYYPRVDIGVCESHADGSAFGFFGVLETDTDVGNDPSDLTITAASSPSLIGETLLDVMNNYPWDEDQVDAFSGLLRTRTHEQHCTRVDATPIVTQTINKPTITSPYTVDTQTCCAVDASTLMQNLTLSQGRRNLPSVLAGVALVAVAVIISY